MKIKTKKVAVGMPPNLYAALEKKAAEQDRTIAGYIRWVLWQHVDEKDL